MNNLNLNDKRVRQALETLFRNSEFEQCDIDDEGIVWEEGSQILTCGITHKNFEKEFADWNIGAYIVYGYHFTWVANGAADWNDGMVLDDCHRNFDELLKAIKEEREAYDEDEGNQPSEDVDGIEDIVAGILANDKAAFCDENGLDRRFICLFCKNQCVGESFKFGNGKLCCRCYTTD